VSVHRTALGIDPDVAGALVVVEEYEGGRRVVATWEAMPTSRNSKDRPRIDAHGVGRLLRHLKAEFPGLVACLEQMQPFPKQGVVSSCTLMRGYAVFEGALAVLDVPFLSVLPRVWKAAVLKGLPQDKAGAIAYASRRYPGFTMPTVAVGGKNARAEPLHGVADALCLADYALRQERAQIG
jgi:hypothetical protein